MFDPTAFDNMKVIMEGNFYDKDLLGEIEITDRNDYVNLAKLSREFDLTFMCKKNNDLTMTIHLSSELQNIAAELLPLAKSDILSGCKISFSLNMKHKNERAIYQSIEKTLQEVWGREHSIQQRITIDPLISPIKVNNVISLTFQHLVYEDQMDDLYEMMDVMIQTIIVFNDKYFTNNGGGNE